MTDPQAIAARLSEAQKRALRTLTTRMEVPKCFTISSNAYKALNDKWGGVLVWAEWQPNQCNSQPPHRRAYRLTTLGMQVRSILGESNEG